MQLDRIRTFIAAYKNWLTKPEAFQRIHWWESQAIWQQNWDLEAPKLEPVYENSLDNNTSRRMWKREAYEPKKMISIFLKMEPEFVRSMFQDLFNEEKSADGRADRFVFYCDQLLQQYRQIHPLSVDTSHYHDDGYQMVSAYLSFQFPDKYAPYDAELFIKLLHRVGAANIPLAGDFARHCKVMRTLHNFLIKEDDLLSLHQARLDENKHYTGNSLLLAYDFVCFVVNDLE